jgi:ArsR family transcriptional regulator
VLKALAHPRRFRMVQEIVAAGELSCGQVGEKFPLSQPTVSHHLKILTDAGVIVARREGQHAYISVDRRLLQEVGGLLPARLAVPRSAARRRAAGKAQRRA